MLTIFTLAVDAANKIARSTAEVFTDLYREFLPRIFRYINYRIADVQQAEDLTSTVFEKALTKFSSYSSEKAAFSTWIFSIARNTLIDYYRVRDKARTVNLENFSVDATENASPEEEMLKSEEYQMLQACISRLAPQEQEIISLKFGGEMTNRQIARMTGLSESNVGVIIYRAVRKLRDNFNRGVER